MTVLVRQYAHVVQEAWMHAARLVFGRTCRILCTILVVIFGILYVAVTSAISGAGYDMASLERQIQKLKQENQQLNFEIAKHQSMTSIQSRVANLDLVSVDTINYVRTDAIVARR